MLVWSFVPCTLGEMDARLVRGVHAFNAGEFFAAHEVWEELWLDSVGPGKQLLQGLVQIAAGYAKVETGIGDRKSVV
jgi:predicted metal-dependent hydrolase